jgi:phosphoribosylformylglycinamidine synthase
MTPVYQRETREPKYLAETRKYNLSALGDVPNAGEMLKTLLGSPTIASKRWVYEQYDSMVRTNSLYLTGCDAAVVRVKGTTKGLAMKTDCNSRYVRLDPYRGAMIAVVEAARNIACTGATPIGVTNCLNFGNPYDPEVYWQFKEAIRGMGDACRALDTPVTGGNVSFYNESPDGAIFPTPTIGMIGVIDDITKVVSSDFKDAGDAVIIFTAGWSGNVTDGLGGSEYLFQRAGLVTGAAPELNIEKEAAIIKTLVQLADRGLLKSAHDLSEGGFAVAVAECCFGQSTEIPLGATIGKVTRDGVSRDTLLFGERQGRVLLSAKPSDVEAIQNLANVNGLLAFNIGTVGGDRLIIGDEIDESVAELFEVYSESLHKALGDVEAVA